MKLHEIQKACLHSNMNVEGMIILDLHYSPYESSGSMTLPESRKNTSTGVTKSTIHIMSYVKIIGNN